jgi:hypothetical protein
MNTKFNKFIFGLCACCGLLSCSDFFDQEPDHIIFAEENHLSNATDTIYSVTGILNKLQAIGDRTVLLGEVRGDLVDITSYANKDIRELAEFNISDDNAYNVPRDYYAVINNCNYFIEKVDTGMKNNRNEYLFMREYAAVKAIRAWTYLQLVLNYKEVPFVTEPILSKQDAEKDYPKYNLQAICEYFINDLAPLTERWGNEYPRYGTIRGNDSRLFYFPLNIVLGDLNLWLASETGSKDTYREAAYRYYKYINERNGDNSAYPTGVNYYAWESGTSSWNSIYGRSSGTLSSEGYGTNSEMITMIAGDSIPAEGNYSELRNLFNSNTDNNYRVSIIPSQSMFNLSESQKFCCVETNGTTAYYAPDNLTEHRTGDLRLYWYYSWGWATNRSTGERMETSYISKYESQNIHIYRRYMLYLRLAEALNGAGYPRAAFQILSTGINNEIKDDYVYPYYSESDSIWLSRLDFDNERYEVCTALEFASSTAVQRASNTIGIHTHGSGWTPLNEYYKLPEAPMPDPVDEDGDGIPDEPVIITKDTPELIKTQQEFVDSLLLNECGLELAFEGPRFYDIMRFAFHQTKKTPEEFLAEKVATRRGKDKVDETLKSRLMNRNNWYLKWKGQIGLY